MFRYHHLQNLPEIFSQMIKFTSIIREINQNCTSILREQII